MEKTAAQDHIASQKALLTFHSLGLNAQKLRLTWNMADLKVVADDVKSLFGQAAQNPKAVTHTICAMKGITNESLQNSLNGLAKDGIAALMFVDAFTIASNAMNLKNTIGTGGVFIGIATGIAFGVIAAYAPAAPNAKPTPPSLNLV